MSTLCLTHARHQLCDFHLVDQQVMQVKSQVTVAIVKLTPCPWGDGCVKSSVYLLSARLGDIWSRATLMWQLPSISVTASEWPQSLGSGHWQVMWLRTLAGHVSVLKIPFNLFKSRIFSGVFPKWKRNMSSYNQPLYANNLDIYIA